MIQKFNAKHRSCRSDPLGQKHVIPAWIRNSARVIVQKKNTDCLMADGLDEDLSRRTQRRFPSPFTLIKSEIDM